MQDFMEKQGGMLGAKACPPQLSNLREEGWPLLHHQTHPMPLSRHFLRITNHLSLSTAPRISSVQPLQLPAAPQVSLQTEVTEEPELRPRPGTSQDSQEKPAAVGKPSQNGMPLGVWQSQPK